MTRHRIEIIGLAHIPEVAPGDDLAELILDAARADALELAEGDVLVVTQKIVSKAEGALVSLGGVEPSTLAMSFAERSGKDPRMVEVALREARRIVKMDRGILITETRHGFVCANSGVDASNVASEDAVTVLPTDPDQSAGYLARRVREATGHAIAVIVSDTFGRPWREGVVNVAIGVASLNVLLDYRGQTDAHGRALVSTVIAVADELASAAELVMGKLDRIPVALVRGYRYASDHRGVTPLLRDPASDLFR